MSAPRSGYQFRSGDFNGEGRHQPGHARRDDPDVPQPPCERGERCAGGRRSPETLEFLPAPAAQHLCLACQAVLAQALDELPAAYDRLAVMSLNPARSGSAVRVPPGSRILASPEADALMREVSDVTANWAARVRAVPQLSLSRHGCAHGSRGQVTADCATLAAHATQFLALPPGEMTRTWTYLPGGRGGDARPLAACRRCGLPVSPAPSGRHWWPAVCTHPRAVAAAYAEDALGNRYPSALACAACSKRLPPGWEPPAPCEHEPSRAVPVHARKTPVPRGPRTLADVEDEIGGLEVVRAGDGWVTAFTWLHGGQGACEVIEARQKAARLLRETPARPEAFDGLPCRDCDTMGSLERAEAPAGPPDPDLDPWSRCSVPGCRAVMTRAEHDAWAAMYAAWAEGSGILVCARCERRECPDCQWPACSCRAAGHAAVRA